jgi:uncharacterized protein
MLAKLAWVLVVVGAINWGLVGAGMLAGKEWNLVSMIFGSMPKIEAVVYLLVGVSALVSIFGCPCKQCKEGGCASCALPEEKKM